MVTKVHAGVEMAMAGHESGSTGNWRKKVVFIGDQLRRFPSLAWKNVWKMGRATLCKGLNRGLGTVIAGALAFSVKYVANGFDNGSDRVFHALFIGTTVCIIGAATSYMRFFPYIKKNYDYGVLIFLLTFNLITVSSYRTENLFKMIYQRFYTIAIGCAICLLMSLLVFPNWSGEALHNSTAFKLEGLAKSIEACVNEYFNGEMEASNDKISSEDIYKGYKAVLDSKTTDETLALHASWEPRHSCHKFPWQQYVKVGTVLRQFGYTVVALHGCLKTEIQTPPSVRVLFKNPCTRLASEVSKVLIELANSIRNHRRCYQEILSNGLQEALQDLNTAIKSQPRLFVGTSSDSQDSDMLAIAAAHAAGLTNQGNGSLSSAKIDSPTLQECKAQCIEQQQQPKEVAERKVLRHQLSIIAITSLEFSEALPFAAFASLLVETVAKLDLVIEEVEELGRLARFKEYRLDDKIIVTCETPRVDILEDHIPTRPEMAMASNESRRMVTGNLMKRVLALGDKLRVFLSLAWESVWKMGRDDPRRVIYAFKVGFSLTLVSLLYLLEPFFKGLGENVIWAVMTVVVVFQFTAGATLCKGLNRGFGTLSAGLLAFLIKYFSSGCGHVFHALVIGATVFIIGASSSYMRFFPCIKKNYDYGVNIFLLTYNLVAVSGYRIDNVFKMAHERFSNIAIGVAICLLMSLLVFPNWSGEALHNSTASKLEGLAKSLEACVNEYFYGEMETSGDKKSSEDIYEGYKAVLDSKSTDETQALHASWEPRHLCRKFPWQQYVKVGTVIRQFGYTVVSLHGCLKTEIQTPQFVRVLFKNHCTRLAKEVSKVLIELANSIRNRRHCSQEILSDNLKEALLDLNTAIKSQPRLFLGSNDYQDNNMPVIPGSQEAGKKTNDANGVKTDSLALQECKTKRACTEQEPPKELAERKVLIRPQLTKIVITSLEFSEALPFAAFASLLVETVVKLDSVIEEVEELGRLACFKEYITDDKIIVSCETPQVDVLKDHDKPSRDGYDYE
ncbi:Aluminum-activated malate transporter 14 [Glycine soja]